MHNYLELILANNFKKMTQTQFCQIYCLKYVTCFLHYPQDLIKGVRIPM